MKYLYSFVVWPDPGHGGHTEALFDYFRVFRRRTEMAFTPEEYKTFVEGLERAGYLLHEVRRRPDTAWESVP